MRICGDAKLPFCQKYVREGAEETLIANITNGNSLRAFARMHRLHDNSVGAVTKKRLKLEAFRRVYGIRGGGYRRNFADDDKLRRLCLRF